MLWPVTAQGGGTGLPQALLQRQVRLEIPFDLRHLRRIEAVMEQQLRFILPFTLE